MESVPIFRATQRLEDLEDDPNQRDASPYLAWEWLIVEALMRERGTDESIWGVPGTLVTKNALAC
jgi:hypothetical protein